MKLRSNSIDTAVAPTSEMLSAKHPSAIELRGGSSSAFGIVRPSLALLDGLHLLRSVIATKVAGQFSRNVANSSGSMKRGRGRNLAGVVFPRPTNDEKHPTVRFASPRHDTTKSPRSFQELVDLMRRAGEEKGSIKALGAGFAFSNIHGTEGYRVRLTDHLNRLLELDRSILKNPHDTNLCRFEGGATIETLTKHLWNLGKALLNQPGYEQLTFIGTASSGGHGSGIRLGPVSDAIRSIHLLTFDEHDRVVQKQLEPTDGITDPKLFRMKYPQIELIQDDALFHAATVSMGSIGVIYSAIIEIQDAFYLREDRLLKPWEDVRAALPSMLADESLHSFHVWFNPYTIANKQDCLVSTYRLAQASTLAKSSSRGIGIRIGASQWMVNILLSIARRIPKSAPIIIREALRASASKNVILPCWQALNLGPPNRLKLTASEYGVDLASGIRAAEELSTVFQSHARATKAYLLSPFALRFVKGSEALMSPMQGRDTCMLEMPLLEGLGHEEKFLELFWRTLAPFGARPHWGQKNNIDSGNVMALFPNFREFKASVQALNRGRLFDSVFTRSLGLLQQHEEPMRQRTAESELSETIAMNRPKHSERRDLEKKPVRRARVGTA